jgi:DNA-binding response OmpR family regulator
VRILVVEDEPAIADFVQRGLQAEGHPVEIAVDGPTGQERAMAAEIDLVVLDRMLPGRDGLQVLQAVRAERPALPVILLTARAEIADRVEGLDAGATDYVSKPFAFEELAARVRAHLRAPAQVKATELSAGGIHADLLTREVTREGTPIHLSAKEFELLAHFLRHPNQVLSREQLLSAVWGYDFDPQTNIVEVYVGYLRKKLALPDSPTPIQTLRSVGYRLRDR